MKKVFFLLSLIILFVSCENELENNYENNEKLIQEVNAKGKTNLDNTATTNKVENHKHVYFDDGDCVYYSVHDPETDTYSYPPSLYYCEDPETGDLSKNQNNNRPRRKCKLTQINPQTGETEHATGPHDCADKKDISDSN